jgi:hypothetical protein
MSEHSTSQLATLIQLGKEQGYLTYAEIVDTARHRTWQSLSRALG